ncbi:MAG: MraY family glycosyltransferase [Thermodesulfobacteriota bacterium]|nr:MraY family glycosyltransferase [Thermodesulfobacteriota bacterium]
MTTQLAIFIISLALSLALTPLAGKVGAMVGAVDEPNERKVHTKTIPRFGGPAIVVSFLLTLSFISLFINNNVSDLLVLNRQTGLILLGAFIVFGAGLLDDLYRLRWTIKLLLQVLGASTTFLAGLKIGHVDFFGLSLHFGVFSYVVTIFWFLLFINAVNLIDGLDGLAAGITFFACAVMVIFSIAIQNWLVASLFTALAGSTLGFLRYNFNPARIFLGDGGSYFLGYAIAAFSIMGSTKSHMGTIMLIPLVGMGVPLFDTILSPVRRFILGQHMFHPDKGHVHHKLVEMGLSTRKAVLFIYGISVALLIFSLILVNFRNEQIGLYLTILVIPSILFLRKVKYFEYFTSDKIFGWLNDLTDEAGLKRDRRTFLSMQMNIINSESLEQLWHSIIKAGEKINLSSMSLDVEPGMFGASSAPSFDWKNGMSALGVKENGNVVHVDVPIVLHGKAYARLSLKKCIGDGGNDRLVLSRIEHLRRSVTTAMGKIASGSGMPGEKGRD